MSDRGISPRARAGDAADGDLCDHRGVSTLSILAAAPAFREQALSLHETFGATAVHVLDWVGTLAFAISGGLLGIKKRFDLFGILFLSFVVAVVGGMIRDVLIGAVP